LALGEVLGIVAFAARSGIDPVFRTAGGDIGSPGHFWYASCSTLPEKGAALQAALVIVLPIHGSEQMTLEPLS
jgi:hypothetical protein